MAVKRQSLHKMGDRHRRAAKMKHAGERYTDIIKNCKISKSAYQNWIHSPCFKEYLEKLEQESLKQHAIITSGSLVKDALQIIESKSVTAARKLEAMLNPEYYDELSHGQKMGVISKIFEMAGMNTQAQGANGTAVQIVIQSSKLQSAKETANLLDPEDIIEINKDGSPVRAVG